MTQIERPFGNTFQSLLPVIVPFIAVGIFWGEQKYSAVEQSAALDRLTQAVTGQSEEIRKLRESDIRRESELIRVREKLVETQISTKTISEMSTLIGRVQVTLDQLTRASKDQWDIIRQNESFRRQMETQTPLKNRRP